MQKKFITLLLPAISSILLIGCMGGSPSAEHKISGHMTQNEMHDAVKSAGEKAGWRMTEFKSDTMIAEKITDSGTKTATVTFDNSSYKVDGKSVSELENAIAEVLH